MATADDVRSALRVHASAQKAALLARYFKTGPGEYAEGDVFVGVMVPQSRAVARQFRDLPLAHLQELLASPVHEERLCALFILVAQYEHGDDDAKESVFRLYLRNTKRINNWDLVDCSAPKILGAHLLATKGSGSVLVKLARSRNLWERRIAMLATAAFIDAGRYLPTLNIARMLLDDQHDLIHKAVGWMLREVGKRIDRETEEEFLRRHYRTMPRTMLRYAVERFPKRLQQAYLAGRI
jgi:3-methyladenine DNA glycosylase AlkD